MTSGCVCPLILQPIPANPRASSWLLAQNDRDRTVDVVRGVRLGSSADIWPQTRQGWQGMLHSLVVWAQARVRFAEEDRGYPWDLSWLDRQPQNPRRQRGSDR